MVGWRLGGQKRIDEAMHLECLFARDRRIAAVTDGVEKIRDQRLMVGVRESHGIGAGTPAGGGIAGFKHLAGVERDLQHGAVENGDAGLADQFDTFRQTGKGARRGS